MTKLVNILISLFCFQALAFGQITLDECFKKARENYPLIKQFDLIDFAFSMWHIHQREILQHLLQY